jgi:hypothetical protein
MKRSRVNMQVWVVTALFTMLAPRLARGDGGIVLLHETQGTFSVTVFVSPEAASGGLTDVSVLVQSRKNGEVVLDADVSLAVDAPNGVAMDSADPVCSPAPDSAALQLPDVRRSPATVIATRAQASNKLLYAAALKLNAAGDWRLHVNVSRGSDTARFDCRLPVTRTSSEPWGLWPYLAFPPIVVTVFGINQWLRRHSLEQALNTNG